jgi:hypothetical protein
MAKTTMLYTSFGIWYYIILLCECWSQVTWRSHGQFDLKSCPVFLAKFLAGVEYMYMYDRTCTRTINFLVCLINFLYAIVVYMYDYDKSARKTLINATLLFVA